MARSNCLFFCLALRRRQLKRGKQGGFYIRKSNHGWFWHFIYQYKNGAGKYRMVHYIPKQPIEGLLFPPVKFEGRVKWGD